MKAVVPAAGLGTRMLPATKSQPKEMLPIVDRPAIQWVVEEALAAGCEEVVVVTGPSKRALADHFGPAPALRALLENKKDAVALEKLDAVEALGRRVRFVEQPEPRGLGDAVLRARHAVGNEPFAVLLGDDILVDTVPATRSLADAHAVRGGSIVLVQEVPLERVRRYGVVDPAPGAGETCWRVRGMVEKPDPARAPSRYAAVGRYLLDPAVFDALAEGVPDARGEVQLTDALAATLPRVPMHALAFTGMRYDAGSFDGWLAANAALSKKQG